MTAQVFLTAVLLLSISMAGVAAEVEYHHPGLTIVAKDEPLDSVLKSVSQEMRIFVTTPIGLNPLVNCDIQDLPLKQAFKKLLGDMSYSLEWKDDGERLVGLTILSSTEGSAASRGADRHSAASGIDQASSPAEDRRTPNSGMAAASGGGVSPMPVDDYSVAVEREQQEARMAEERAARDAEMEQRRQEEVIAHEARMEEEAVRNKAQMTEYFESQGINPDP